MIAGSKKSPLGRFFQRNRILQAAARVFSRRGARDATVEDLLKEADVSRGTFYKFFRNQEEVLAALYEVSCDLLLGQVRRAFASAPDPIDKLERTVDIYLAFNRTSGALLRVLEGEALRPGSPLAARRIALLDAASRELSQLAAESFGEPADPLMVYGVLVALEGISYRMHAEGHATDEQLARARRAMLGLLTTTLAARHPHQRSRSRSAKGARSVKAP